MKTPIYKKLINQWKKLNYNIDFGPINEVELLEVEAKYDLKLPDDFRLYLLNACPKPHGYEMDKNYASWWPIEQIKAEGLEGRYIKPGYVVFADHCIMTWTWAICCISGPNFGQIIWSDGAIVANNFSEFVDRYIKDSPEFIGAPD